MGWESSGVVGFDLGPFLQGQTRTAKLKTAYNSLLILEVWDGKPTYRKSWAGSLLVWSDLTLGLLQGQTRIAKVKSKAATILRLLGNETIQLNTRSKKSEPGLRKQLNTDVKSTTKFYFFFKYMNIFIYFTNISVSVLYILKVFANFNSLCNNVL